jgi:hypothetical protein
VIANSSGARAAPAGRAATVSRALTIKRHNAITAGFTGSALAAFAAWRYGVAPLRFAPLVFLLAAACGVLYANAFEYVLHRFFLHWGNGFLVQRHALHHNSAGAEDEARYINFATSPFVVVMVFVLNAPAVFVLLHWLGSSSKPSFFATGVFGAGIFAGFTIYYIIYEEIHWRIHMGGWLPRWMGFARRHHMLHHGEFEGHYSVFLPIFDWIFAHLEGKRGLANPH